MPSSCSTLARRRQTHAFLPGVLSFACLAVAPLFSISSARAQTAGTPTAALPHGIETTFMDLGADPCVDFAQYACGRFDKLHPIPPSKTYFEVDDLTREYVSDKVRQIVLSASSLQGNRTQNQQKIGDFYAACIDAETLHKRSDATLHAELLRTAHIHTRAELSTELAHQQLLETGIFVAVRVMSDSHDARHTVVSIDQASLGLPERGYYLRDGKSDVEIRDKYVQHIARMLALAGTQEPAAQTDAHKILEMETKLAEASLSRIERRDPSIWTHTLSLPELTALVPGIDWPVFFRAMDMPVLPSVNVVSAHYLGALATVLGTVDPSTLAAYLKWRLLDSIPGLDLSAAFDAEDFEFKGRTLQGQQQLQPRPQRCLSSTMNNLGDAVAQVFVVDNLAAASKAAAQQIADDVVSAMLLDIDQLDWMSADTKLRAKQKAHATSATIGTPNKWKDYATLTVRRDDALADYLAATRYEQQRAFAHAGTLAERDDFLMSPTVVGAWYTANRNGVYVPAGQLEPPYLDPNASDAANYGHLAALIGHELTHGFDDSGRKYNGDGNLEDWWTPQDVTNFGQRAACVVDEYHAFNDGDVHVDGKLTLGEDLADNGGLRLAFMAFLLDAERKKIDLQQKTDGLTASQQFFVAFGQDWCGATRPETERMLMQSDPHPPSRFRANGAVQNLSQFGEAFGCKKGQPMMPVNACRVW